MCGCGSGYLNEAVVLKTLSLRWTEISVGSVSQVNGFIVRGGVMRGHTLDMAFAHDRIRLSRRRE